MASSLKVSTINNATATTYNTTHLCSSSLFETGVNNDMSLPPKHFFKSSFGTIFGKYYLSPWDWGGVGVDPRFPREGLSFLYILSIWCRLAGPICLMVAGRHAAFCWSMSTRECEPGARCVQHCCTLLSRGLPNNVTN
eukprot:98461-Amphidinium_carterae.1